MRAHLTRRFLAIARCARGFCATGRCPETSSHQPLPCGRAWGDNRVAPAVRRSACGLDAGRPYQPEPGPALRARRRNESLFVTISSFTELALAQPLLRALATEGYQHPTPIQAQ